MRLDAQEVAEEKQTDYYEDIFQAKVDSLLVKWESVEPFRFTEAQESEEEIVAVTPVIAKGLLLYNVIRESLLNPNKTTVISKKTGKILSPSSELP